MSKLGGVQRIVAVLAIVVGLGLVVLPVAQSLFERTQAGQRVLDKFRHVTADPAGFAQLKKDMDATLASANQFRDEMAPALAADLKISEAQFGAFIEREYPRIAAGAANTPKAKEFLEPFVATLVDTQDEFAAVEEIPTRWLSLTTAPWLLVAAGLLLVGVGAALVRRSSRIGVAAVAVIGLGMVVLPLAWSLPGKTSDAEKVVEVANAGLKPETAELSAALNAATDQVIADTQVGLIPDIAQRLDVSVSELTARLTRDFPATMSYLAAWPSIEDRNAVLLDGMATGYADLREAEKIPFRTLPWLMIGIGALLVLAAAGALATAALGARRPTAATSDTVPEPLVTRPA